MSAGLGNLPDIFQKYVDQPWWNAYKQMFEQWMQNPTQGNQVTLPPMVQPGSPQQPTTPTTPTTPGPPPLPQQASYAPFTGALPAVVAINPFGTNEYWKYDDQGDMDARMALGGAGARMPVPPVVAPPPTQPRPPGQNNPRPPVVQPRPPGGQPPVYPGPTRPVPPSLPTRPAPPVGQNGPGWYSPSTGYGYWPQFSGSTIGQPRYKPQVQTPVASPQMGGFGMAAPTRRPTTRSQRFGW